MSTITGVFLAVLAGMLLWAIPRVAVTLPAWGLRVFWVALITILLVSTKMPEPYNLAIMGLLAGMAIFENLYHRHQIRSAARKAAKAAKTQSRKSKPTSGG